MHESCQRNAGIYLHAHKRRAAWFNLIRFGSQLSFLPTQIPNVQFAGNRLVMARRICRCKRSKGKKAAAHCSRHLISAVQMKMCNNSLLSFCMDSFAIAMGKRLQFSALNSTGMMMMSAGQFVWVQFHFFFLHRIDEVFQPLKMMRQSIRIEMH